MSKNHTKLLLVTANVGSIFEDPDRMLKLWLTEFLAAVTEKSPDFLAIHCQEVGGKNYEESMKHVNMFVKALLASDALSDYDKAQVFLDEDFTAVDKFTALGSLYFVHQSVVDIHMWDFEANKFIQMVGKEVHSANIENITIKEKAKFPQEFFPNHKWSRKGFIRTRWNISNTVFDLINIHLFHDASNIVAMETSPSEYCTSRKNALLYTIKRFETDSYPTVPYFMFGDFNFRLDTLHIVQSLTEKLQEIKHTGKKNDVDKIVYTPEGESQEVILSVEKKGFEHRQHEEIFLSSSEWLKGFDTEFQSFGDKLQEYPITFPPSYPFSEDVDDGRSYMRTRCPSWCDRIVFTQSAKQLIIQDDSAQYGMMGNNVCMGDHKPIFLSVKLRHGKGKAYIAGTTTPSSEYPPHQSVLYRKPDSLKKVISINGEECSAEKIENINIHDFTSFEHEQLITGGFIGSVRRRTICGDPRCGNPKGRLNMLTKPGFKEVVRGIMRAERVIKLMYSHRSDTEDSDLEDELAVPETPLTAEPSPNTVPPLIEKTPVFISKSLPVHDQNSQEKANFDFIGSNPDAVQSSDFETLDPNQIKVHEKTRNDDIHETESGKSIDQVINNGPVEKLPKVDPENNSLHDMGADVDQENLPQDNNNIQDDKFDGGGPSHSETLHETETDTSMNLIKPETPDSSHVNSSPVKSIASDTPEEPATDDTAPLQADTRTKKAPRRRKQNRNRNSRECPCCVVL